MDWFIRQIQPRRRRRKTRVQVTALSVFTSRVLPGKRRLAVRGRAGFTGLQEFFCGVPYTSPCAGHTCVLRTPHRQGLRASESPFSGRKCRFPAGSG